MFDRLTTLFSDALAGWHAAARHRRTLAELSRMSDAHLDDIGLTRGDVMAMEAGRMPRSARPARPALRLVSSRPAITAAPCCAPDCCKAA